MAQPPPSLIVDTRAHQMFPTLGVAEIERLRRFGSLRSYAAGEALAQVVATPHTHLADLCAVEPPAAVREPLPVH
jgi:hypothetical protein